MTKDEEDNISLCCYKLNCQIMDYCDFHWRQFPAMKDEKTEPCDKVVDYYNDKEVRKC